MYEFLHFTQNMDKIALKKPPHSGFLNCARSSTQVNLCRTRLAPTDT